MLAPDGRVVEEAEYVSAEYDVAYSRRDPCAGAWLENGHPTPGERNTSAPPAGNGWRVHLPVAYH